MALAIVADMTTRLSDWFPKQSQWLSAHHPHGVKYKGLAPLRAAQPQRGTVPMNAANLLIRCLEEEGVRYIFGVPGEETMGILEALSKSERITFIPTRHEQGAAFMADVWGRLTGEPGVCLGTLGPGATNLLTGVADAFLDHAPLVAITGQAGLERTFKESHQAIDVVAMFAPVTKWNARLERSGAIPEVTRKAFRVAQLEKQGPTHIEAPEDVMDERVGAKAAPIRITEEPRMAPDARAVAAARDLLVQARQPVILAGNGVIRARAAEPLAALARALRIPVAHTFMGKGILRDDDPLSWGTLGARAGDAVMDGIDEADLVIAAGYDLVEHPPQVWNHQPKRPLIHVDSLPAELDAAYLPSVELVGDIGEALCQLGADWTGAPFTAPTVIRQRVEAEWRDHAASDIYPLAPQRVLADLRAALDAHDIVISDVGAHKQWVARRFPTYWANTVIISNGLATMGIGVPGGVAAKLAHPERNVVVVTGDGGFMMNMQELETAARLKLPFVTLVWTDEAYGVIEWKQSQRYGHTFGTRFTNPDFRQLAASLGIAGYKIESAGALLPTLHEALALDIPSLIEIPVDYRENARLLSSTQPEPA
jgi:acetolactate synthase-1/2/3 large subunit